MTRRPLLSLALAAAVWGALSCLDISSPVTGIGSISPVLSPSPSVVVGDTARDSTGAAVPLRVVAFAPNGDTVRDANVELFVLDTTGGLVVTPAGLAYGNKISPAAKVVARVTPAHGSGALQTDTFPLPVVPVPQQLTATTTTDTLKFNVKSTDTLTGNNSAPLSVLLHGPDTTVVRSYVIQYAFDSASVPAGRDGQPLVLLVDDAGHPSMIDTTDLSGNASRRLRLRIVALTAEVLSGTDSVIVYASATYRGQPVEGSPLRFVVYLTLAP